MMKKIDLHSHYLSPGFVKFLDDYFDGKGDGVPTPAFSVDDYLKLMAEEDIDYSVLSISSPHLSAAPDEVMLELTEEVNAYAEDLHHAHSDQLGYFASLPLPLVDESIRMIDHVLDEQQATVAIHPNEPKPVNEAIKAQILSPLMEFFFDTTRTIIFMSQNNVFSKYPNIKWIVPHSGALLPVIAQRVNIGNKMFNVENGPDDIEQVMQSLYFDLAGMVLPHQLPTLLKMVDEDKIVYGADAPYTTDQVIKRLAKDIESTDLLTEEQKEKFLHRNASQLLGF